MTKGMFLAAAVFFLAGNLRAEEILVGLEGRILSQSRGFIEIDTGRDQKERILIRTSKIVLVRSGRMGDNNAQTQLLVETGATQNLIITIPRRAISYESIRDAILTAQ